MVLKSGGSSETHLRKVDGLRVKEILILRKFKVKKIDSLRRSTAPVVEPRTPRPSILNSLGRLFSYYVPERSIKRLKQYQ